MCEYVCMHACVYIYMHVYTYALYIYGYVCACMCGCACMSLCVYLRERGGGKGRSIINRIIPVKCTKTLVFITLVGTSTNKALEQPETERGPQHLCRINKQGS